MNTHEYTQLYPQNEEVFVPASFGGDVKPSVLGSWLILATCAIQASSLVTFGKTIVEKKKHHTRDAWTKNLKQLFQTQRCGSLGMKLVLSDNMYNYNNNT